MVPEACSTWFLPRIVGISQALEWLYSAGILATASPLTPVLKVAGVGYDHAAAAGAKRRILAFFDVHLGTATPENGTAADS